MRLDLRQKQSIIEYYDTNQQATLDEIATWAKTTLSLEGAPSLQTISRLLRARVDEDRANLMPHCKTYRKLGSDQLIKHILEWIDLCEQHELPIVTYRTIREKATQFSILHQDILRRLDTPLDSPPWSSISPYVRRGSVCGQSVRRSRAQRALVSAGTILG